MGSEWREVSLGDVCKIRRGSSPRPIVDFLSETEGMPWVKIADATESDSRFIEKTNQFIKEEGVCKSVIVEKGDLILSNSGTAGLPKFMSITACIHDGWQVLKDLDGITSDYLYYTLLYIRLLLLHNAYDSTMKNLTLDMVREAKVQLPPLPEQKAIAHILGTLDDKIELNRRMNATLEGMAQALFKSWFVDFDPVIDNALAAGNPIPDELAPRAEVRRQALANGTAQQGSLDHPTLSDRKSLFPATFQSTEELGWVPEGWEVRAIGDSFQLLGGHSFKSGDYVEDGRFGIVTIKNVQDGSFVQECTNRITEIPGKMKSHCHLNSGDVLLSLTGNVGRVCVISEGDFLLNQRVSKIVGRDGIPEAFGYFFFRQETLYERMITIAKGTAQQNLSPIETAKLEQAMPCNQTIVELGEHLREFHVKMVGNTSQSQTLTKLRDTLLPKLISGELRIPEAEQLIEKTLDV
jgi:type I restriction enzyme S subunit